MSGTAKALLVVVLAVAMIIAGAFVLDWMGF
jgi:hypothetical protein